MKREQVQAWYQAECQKSGAATDGQKQPSYYQKWIAFTLLFSAPLVLSGCAEDQLTAEDECEWERESNGQWEIDCDNDSSSSSWYRSHGYSSKHSPVHTSSPILKKGMGSGGKKSGGFFSGG